MAQIGNAANSKLNREWAKHVRKRLRMKRRTAHIRRQHDKKILNQMLTDL